VVEVCPPEDVVILGRQVGKNHLHPLLNVQPWVSASRVIQAVEWECDRALSEVCHVDNE
jgi:REP element-mobilizing transposase RayT